MLKEEFVDGYKNIDGMMTNSGAWRKLKLGTVLKDHENLLDVLFHYKQFWSNRF